MTKFVLAALLTALAGGATASTTTINFDGYVDGTNLNGVDLGGVTVTNPSGQVDVYSNSRFGVGYGSPNNAIGSFSTGTPLNNNPMVFTFDAPVSNVSLSAGDAGGTGGDLDQWQMAVYDTSNTLVTTLTSPIWNGSPYTTLTYSGSDVGRIEVSWIAVGCCGIGYDDLSFDTAAVAPVPLPAGGVLLLGGLGLLARVRRRRI